MTTKYYNYMLLDPFITGRWFDTDVCWLYEPFYVGKGQGTRYKWCGHKSSLESHQHKNHRIKDITNRGGTVIVVVFRENTTEETALFTESATISTLGTRCEIPGIPPGPLTNNKTEGTVAKYSQEARDKMSAAAKQRVRQPHSEETKQKMRAAAAALSIQQKEAIAAAISLAHKGKKLSVEQCERLSKLHKGKKLSPAHREAFSMSGKGRVKSPEELQCIRERQQKTWTIQHEITGDVIEIIDLKSWCYNMNINYYTLVGTMSRKKFHKHYMIIGSVGGNH